MRKDKLHTFITTNTWLKLASLVLAVILWFFVVSKGHSVVTIDVPVGFKNIPANLEIMKRPETVKISIEGQERSLKKLRREDIRVIIDLTNTKKGNIFFTLSSDNIKLPNNLTMNDISPQTIKLVIEEKVVKSVPVRTIIIGVPARGFLIEKVQVVPKTIDIKGPESVIAKIFSVKTEPIDITGIESNLEYRAYLDVTKENLKLDTPEVEVSITVKESR